MSEEITTETKSNGIKSDWFYAAGGLGGFFAILKSSGWIDTEFDFSAIYNMVDFAAIAAKVSFISALVWTIFRVVFPATLGKDFGANFNIGWGSMSPAEKTRWILGTFLFLFFSIMISWGSK
jgi:hypothetical protein